MHDELFEKVGYNDYSRSRKKSFKPKNKLIEPDKFHGKVLAHFQQLQKETGAELDLSIFVSLLHSGRCTTGDQGELLLYAIGKKAVATKNTVVYPFNDTDNSPSEKATFVDIRHGKSFISDIQALRKKIIKSKNTVEMFVDEINAIATEFYVTEEYVLGLVKPVGKDEEKTSIHYPDLVMVYKIKTSNKLIIVVSESKITGENDSKSIPKNKSQLKKTVKYCPPGKDTSVEMAVTLLVTDKCAKRWKTVGDPEVHVFSAGEILKCLFGWEISSEEMSALLSRFAEDRAKELYIEYDTQCKLSQDEGTGQSSKR